VALSWIYEKVIAARNALYDRGVFDSFDLGARTISIGNITTGGTGKTPLVAHVAEILAARGERACILTRGYARENAKDRVLVSDGDEILADPRRAGDEPFELARKLLGKAIVIADADRVGAGEWAKRRFDVTAFILDDGFQHRKVKRDLDIVCIDATDPFGGGKMLPLGRLREPSSNLHRADIVVITRADLARDISDLKSQISNLNQKAAIYEAKNEIARVVSLEKFSAAGNHGAPDYETQEKVHSAIHSLAFCAIGNPDSFFELLRRDGFSITATKPFRDHHSYKQSDVTTIETLSRESGSEILLTTAKDAVKLSELRFEIPCFMVEVKTVVDDAGAFAAKLQCFFDGGSFLSPQ